MRYLGLNLNSLLTRHEITKSLCYRVVRFTETKFLKINDSFDINQQFHAIVGPAKPATALKENFLEELDGFFNGCVK